MRSVSIHTLGCKLNFAESGTLERQFQDRQYDVVPFGSPADVTVINTCTVTEEADRKCRQVVRRAIRSNPETFVVVTGCYAQLQPEEIATIPGVDAVLGANEKLQLFNYIDAFIKKEKTQVSVSCIDDVKAFGPAYASGDRTRAFLKVQDGCDYVCSFCTIPFARGKSRSAAIEDVVGQAHEIGDAGYKEIVISGVNINSNSFIPVIVRVEPDPSNPFNALLSLSHDGNTIAEDIVLSNWQTESNWDFSFAGRTGAQDDNHWIDNINITGADSLGGGFTTLKFAGTADDINAALATLTYRGNQDFNGSDTITIEVNDQGYTGAGGSPWTRIEREGRSRSRTPTAGTSAGKTCTHAARPTVAAAAHRSRFGAAETSRTTPSLVARWPC